MKSTKQNITKKGEARRRLILHTVLEMISTGGVDSITHRRVAERAGVPLGSTTYYFESRQHLIRDAFDLYLQETREAMKSYAKQFDVPFSSSQKLVDAWVDWTIHAIEDRATLLVEYEMVLYAARDPQVASSLHSGDEFEIKRLAKVFERVGARQPLQLAEVLLNMVRGYELDSLSRPESDIEGLKRRLNFVVSGLWGTW
ncbi:MAG: TetR family transcriptional regulator [Arenicellales bacterium]|nr:TetR family transcriptional regulator [Arenicellales bacterium]